MIKIKLVLFKGKKLSDERHPIMIRITDSGISKYIATGFSAFPEEWDDSAMSFKNAYKKNCMLTQPQFDLQITALSQKLNDARNDLLEMQRNKKRISLGEVVNKIRNVESFVNFYSYTEKIIKENRSSGKLGNAEIYNSVLSIVKEFQGEKELLLHNINYNWLKEFEIWNLSKELSINSLSVYMRTIRAIINRAIAEGKLDAGLYPFRKYKIQSTPTRKRAISKDAIDKIRNLDLPENSTLWHVKNYFLFSFYCRGMNWIDMANLKLPSIVNGRIEYIRAKTRHKSEKSFSIKINDKIQEILKWYCAGKKQNDYIFPIIQRKDNPELARMDIKNNLKLFNKYLRKIGEMCKIEGHLTSYVSRHSWGTIAKKMGIDIAIISDGYGHADMQVTQIYLDSIENDEIDKANELIIS